MIAKEICIDFNFKHHLMVTEFFWDNYFWNLLFLWLETFVLLQDHKDYISHLSI